MMSGDGKCVVFGSVGDANDIGINSGSASVYCYLSMISAVGV